MYLVRYGQRTYEGRQKVVVLSELQRAIVLSELQRAIIYTTEMSKQVTQGHVRMQFIVYRMN